MVESHPVILHQALANITEMDKEKCCIITIPTNDVRIDLVCINHVSIRGKDTNDDSNPPCLQAYTQYRLWQSEPKMLVN